MEPVKEVVDEAGRVLALGKMLGEGGEGRVYLTDHPDLLVKLRFTVQQSEAAGAADDLEALAATLRGVRRLDLDGVPIARPESVLRPPDVGFVMRMRPGKRPLAELLCAETETGAWWTRTGGTEGRLRELGRTAAAVALLHRRGVVVGDISPRNVLGGQPTSEEPIVLIDPDGLRTADRKAGTSAFSPPHVAPEVYRGDPHTTASDVFALAALAAHVLLLVPPFVGDEVHARALEAEEAALTGELPWVHDRDDRSNATAAGIAPNGVLTPGLRDLLDRCFGPGRGDPWARPTAAGLAIALLQAADACRRCLDGCDAGPADACVVCDRPFAPCPAFVCPPEGEREGASLQRLMLWFGSQRLLERRTALGDLEHGHEPILLIRLAGERIWLERIGRMPIEIVGGRPLGFEVPVAVDLVPGLAFDVGKRRFELEVNATV